MGYLESLTVFGKQLIDVHSFLELLARFSLNILVVYIIVRLIFYPIYKERQYIFTYFLINLSVFMVSLLLSSIKLKIGFAFGMFAIFSIIRYRTEPISIKHMTYLFVVIIVAVLNAMMDTKVSVAELLFSNFSLVFATYILEKKWVGRDSVKEIRYEKIDLVKPEKYDEFIKDLKERTGLNIQKAQVDEINFINDTARIKIYYRE